MNFVYVIRNSISHITYIGQTSDLAKRIARHNHVLPVKASSFTHKQKGNGIWEYIYIESYNNRKQATVREKQLKTSRGRNFIKNLQSVRPVS